MKQTFATRSFTLVASLLLLGTQGSKAGILKNWVNTSGGSWFDANNWSPNAVPTNGDAVTITNSGTYTVYAPTGAVTCAVFTIGGASGKQTFVYGSAAGGQILMTNSVVQNNGVLAITNGGVTGAVLVQPGGELDFNSRSPINVGNFALTNQGTVTWTNGDLIVGGTANTFIANSGIWNIAMSNSYSLEPAGGGSSYFYNSGSVQKTNGVGGCVMTTTFINFPSGTVNVTISTLTLTGQGTNVMGGAFTTTAPGYVIFQGNNTDGGGTMSGTGHFQFTSGNLYLRTNVNQELQLLSGEVFITDPTTFQGGAITELTLYGANLHGTNQIAGTVTVSPGRVEDCVTVLPGGRLTFQGGSELYYTSLLVNLGTVECGLGGLSLGHTPPTVISNGGTWTFTSDSLVQNGGEGAILFTNAGVVQKTGGNSSSSFFGVPFVNLPSGVIRSESGTLQMPNGYTNVAGEIQLAGAAVSAQGSPIYMTSGTLDGSGGIRSAAVFDGGTVSPQPLIQFSSDLMLGTNVTLVIDGTGTDPGFTYDQLSVAGTVVISNATLQVTSLPDVPLGTEFVIIDNTTTNPTTGAFKGLVENAQLIISGQQFRIHYSGGDGNDVVLVRDATAQLYSGGYTNKTFELLGVGGVATIYTIQASTNLLQWMNIGYATGDVSGNFLFTDTNASNYLRRFYRTTN
jgi:hypothetical protein